MEKYTDCPLCRIEIMPNDVELIDTQISNDIDFECVICLEKINISKENTLSKLKCNHIFCTNCINLWDRVKHNLQVYPNENIIIIEFIRRSKTDIYPVDLRLTSSYINSYTNRIDRIHNIKSVYMCSQCNKSYYKNGFSRTELKKKILRKCQFCTGTRQMHDLPSDLV